jgi:hypothetical protein
MPIRAHANHGWAAKRRQAAAIFVSPAQCIKPMAVLRNAAAPYVGPILIERDIADPMDLIFDRPVLPDQTPQPFWSRPFGGEAGHTVDHFGTLSSALLDGDTPLDLAHLGQAGPVTVLHQRRPGGQMAFLEAAMPVVHRVVRRHGLGQGGGLLEAPADILRQLGWVSLHDHPIIPAAFHQSWGDGALREPGLHGEHPSLQEKTAQAVFQDGDLLGLVRDGLLPHGSPQAVTAYRPEVNGWRPVFATAA